MLGQPHFKTSDQHLARLPTVSWLALGVSILALGISLYSAVGKRGEPSRIDNPALPQGSSASKTLDRLPAVETAVADLGLRLSRVQTDLASLRDRDWSAAGNATTETAAFALPGQKGPPSLPVDPGDPPPTIVQQYFDQWGQSDWGETTAASIDTAALENPFFSRAGGNVIADCRQTVCRVEWLPGAMEDVPPDSREDVLAAARYEMLALAARNGTDVGQMATEWISDERGRALAVTFERIPNATQ